MTGREEDAAGVDGRGLPYDGLSRDLRQEIASMALARDLERLAQARLKRTRRAGDE